MGKIEKIRLLVEVNLQTSWLDRIGLTASVMSLIVFLMSLARPELKPVVVITITEQIVVCLISLLRLDRRLRELNDSLLVYRK